MSVHLEQKVPVYAKRLTTNPEELIQRTFGQGTTPRGASSKGGKTRQEVVNRALRIAAVKGLGAVSIGSRAKELKMSKSGFFIHFGSEEKLELAIWKKLARSLRSRYYCPT